MSHTPGPWYITGFGPGRMFEIQAGGKTIYLVMPATGNTNAHDAALMVASPKLLASLERCLRYGDLLPELAEEARAAIAAALAPIPDSIIRPEGR